MEDYVETAPPGVRRHKSLTLMGSIKSKKNSKVATMIGGKNVPKRPIIVSSKAYQGWERAARQEAMTQWREGVLTCPVSVKVIAYFSGPQPDLSGVLESVGDCLEGIVWENDKQVVSWDGSRLYHDAKTPRTEITVYWWGWA